MSKSTERAEPNESQVDNLIIHPSLVQMVRPITIYHAKTKKATAPAENNNFVLNSWRFRSGNGMKVPCICALGKENEYQIETRCSELMKAKIRESDDKRCAYITINVGKNTAPVREVLYDMFSVSAAARKGKKGSGPIWIRPVHFHPILLQENNKGPVKIESKIEADNMFAEIADPCSTFDNYFFQYKKDKFIPLPYVSQEKILLCQNIRCSKEITLTRSPTHRQDSPRNMRRPFIDITNSQHLNNPVRSSSERCTKRKGRQKGLSPGEKIFGAVSLKSPILKRIRNKIGETCEAFKSPRKTGKKLSFHQAQSTPSSDLNKCTRLEQFDILAPDCSNSVDQAPLPAHQNVITTQHQKRKGQEEVSQQEVYQQENEDQDSSILSSDIGSSTDKDSSILSSDTGSSIDEDSSILSRDIGFSIDELDNISDCTSISISSDGGNVPNYAEEALNINTPKQQRHQSKEYDQQRMFIDSNGTESCPQQVQYSGDGKIIVPHYAEESMKTPQQSQRTNEQHQQSQRTNEQHHHQICIEYGHTSQSSPQPMRFDEYIDSQELSNVDLLNKHQLANQSKEYMTRVIFAIMDKLGSPQIISDNSTNGSIKKERHLILIRPLSSRRMYNDLIHPLIQQLPRLMLPSHRDNIETTVSILDQTVRAKWILSSFADSFPEEFISIGKSQLNLIKLKPMSVPKTLAMYISVGLNENQIIRLRSWLRQEFGVQFFASTNECRKMRGMFEVACPTFGIEKIEDKKGKTHTIRFYNAPMAENIIECVEEYFSKPDADPDKVKRIDIVLSGDHGAGSFVNVIKTILLDADNSYGKLLHESEFQQSHIKSKKDSYEIIKRTIGAGLKEMLQDLIESGGIDFMTSKSIETSAERSISNEYLGVNPIIGGITKSSDSETAVEPCSLFRIDAIGGGGDLSESTQDISESMRELKPCAAGDLCRAPWITTAASLCHSCHDCKSKVHVFCYGKSDEGGIKICGKCHGSISECAIDPPVSPEWFKSMQHETASKESIPVSNQVLKFPSAEATIRKDPSPAHRISSAKHPLIKNTTVVSARISDPIINNINGDTSIQIGVRRVPMYIYIVGDLKFYGMMHGKPNMDGKWCYACDKSPREAGWLDEPGVGWTNAKIAEHRKLRHTEAKKRKGIVANCEQLATVEIGNYIFPVLHGVTLLVGPEVDDQLTNLIVDQYAEELPKNILDAQKAYEDAKYPIGDTEVSTPLVAKCRKEYSKLLGKVKSCDKIVRNKFEDEYAKIGIEKGVIHGGKLQGPQSRALMRYADKTFRAFATILKNSQNRRGFLADDAKVDDLMQRYIDLLTITDYLNSLIMVLPGTMSDDDIKRSEEVIKCFKRCWLELGLSEQKIKLHCILFHLVQCLKRFRGMKIHNESFVEMDHQKRIRHEARLRCLKKYEDKQIHYLKEEKMRKDPAIIKAFSEYDTERKRLQTKEKEAKETVINHQKFREEIFQKVWAKVQNDEPLKEWFIKKPLPLEKKKTST